MKKDHKGLMLGVVCNHGKQRTLPEVLKEVERQKHKRVMESV